MRQKPKIKSETCDPNCTINFGNKYLQATWKESMYNQKMDKVNKNVIK